MSEIVYMNGTFRSIEQAMIDPSDRGFTLADGVFDTLLAVDGEPKYAEAHFERLTRHAAVLDIPVPETAKRLATLASGVLIQNGLMEGRCAIRTTLTRGPAARGLQQPANPRPTLIMRASITPEPKRQVTATIAETVRRNEGSPLSRIKSLNYGDQILALREAGMKKADDAILLNNKGHVCCGTAGTLLAVIDGRCLTPPCADGVLDGISRARILAAGLAKEQSITADMLERAEAAFLCNSIAGPQAIFAIGHRLYAETTASLDIESQLKTHCFM